MASGASYRAERLKADDMLSLAEAAVVAGVDLDTIRSWIASGRVIALQAGRSCRLPRWQFGPAVREALPRLYTTLDSMGPWRLLNFLETPLGGLGGLTPRQAIEQGLLERVLALAVEEG